MQKKCNKNIFFLIWLILLSAHLQSTQAQSCCCDEVVDIDVPGGDFEVPPFPAPGGWIDYTTGQFLGPWEITGGSVSHHDDGHNNLGDGNPNPSQAHLDINGFSVGSVCQPISGFVIGQEYQLVFYYAIHNALSMASARVEIDGGIALNETWDATNAGNIEWLENSFFFTATAETMDLCFYSLTNVGCCGMLIDDIEIIVNCIVDEEIPEIITATPDEWYDCFADVPDPIAIEAMDNCAQELNIEFSEELSSLDSCDVVITRSWTVEDDCGNLATQTQSIYVQDNVPPQTIQPLNSMTVSCDQDVESIFLDWIEDFGGGTVVDDCSAVQTTVDHQISNFNECSENVVTFIFSDLCGNEIIELAYFDIIDNQPPFLTIFPEDLNVPCNENAQILIQDWLNQNAYAELIDNCSFVVENDFNGYYDISQTIIFTATDLCGNQFLYTGDINLDHEVEIVEIDTFTCDPSQVGLMEIFIDNEYCDSLLIYDFALLASDTTLIEVNSCNILEQGKDTLYLTNEFLCDSLVIINTSYKAGDTLYSELKTCDITEVGLDTLFLTNVNNCDSLVVIHSIFSSGDTLYNELTSCDIMQVGVDTLFLSNANNCDSLVVINTMFSDGDTLYNEQTTCDIMLVGVDTLFLSNANNCDSLVVINTIFSNGDTLYNEQTTCDIMQVGVDTIFLSNANNCDSLVVINTIFSDGDTLYNSIPTCDPSAVNTDTLMLTNAHQCDSVVITNTYLQQIDTIFMTEYSCAIDQAEFYNLVLPGPICDTILSIALLPLSNDTVFLDINTCKFSQVGVEMENYTNALGCDSVVISNYIYVPSDTTLVNSETCLLDEVLQDTVTIITENCDSTIIYSITLLEENLTFQETFTCNAKDAQIDTTIFQNIFGCDSMVITTNSYYPFVFDIIDQYDPCEDLKGSIEITNMNGATQPYLFSFDGISFTEQSSYAPLESGVYTIYAQDINGCISEPRTVIFDPYEPIAANLPLEIIISSGAPYQLFIEFTVPPDTFYWSDENMVSCNHCLDPFILTTEDTELTLYYEDSSGCLLYKVISITVINNVGGLLIPNIFSPNHDNINDFFQIFSDDPLAKLEQIEIFDRWGNRIFYIHDIAISDLKWDGKFNGSDVADGIYIYQIITLDNQGESQRYIGDITLMR